MNILMKDKKSIEMEKVVVQFITTSRHLNLDLTIPERNNGGISSKRHEKSEEIEMIQIIF